MDYAIQELEEDEMELNEENNNRNPPNLEIQKMLGELEIRKRAVSFAEDVESIGNSEAVNSTYDDDEDDVDMDALWLQHKLRSRTSRATPTETGNSGLWNRRNSVVDLPKNKGHLTFTRNRRVSLAPGPAIPKRRKGSQGTLSSLVSNYRRESLDNDVRPRLAFALDLDYEESQFAKIIQKTIELSIPVYSIAISEKNVCVTDIKSIEDALSSAHPEVTLLKNVDGANDPTLRTDFKLSPSPTTDSEKPPLFNSRLAVIPENDRKCSIGTCVKRMRKESKCYEEQLIGCRNVGNYAYMETLKVVLSKQDAIGCVLKAMASFQDREELQLVACKSLLQMASASANNCKILTDMKGIPVLVKTVERFCRKADVVRTIMRIFGFMSTCDDLICHLVQNGCHSHVLRMMTQHAEDSSIVNQCCVILANLVTTVKTAEQIMNVGGIHTIISMMEHFSEDADILENGCRAIGSFAALDDICLDVAQAGGTKAIISAMTTQKTNVCLQESGCWALACLSCMADTCEDLLEMDGIGDILDSVEIHPKEESVQEYGIRAISNLAVLDTTVESVANERVIKIMADTTVESVANERVIKSMADTTVESVANERVIIILQKSITYFPYNVELQENVVNAISEIIQADDEIKSTFLRKDGVKSVITVMMTHEENISIQQYGCTILGNLAVNETLRRQTEEDGASKAVIAAMLTLDTTEEIQEYGCMALINLTADVLNNKIRVKNNGGVMALLCCLQNFQTNPEIVLSALKTLGNIIELNEVCRLLVDEGGLKTIVQITDRYRQSSDIQLFAAMVLSGLSQINDLGSDVISTVDAALMKMCSPDDPDLSMYACQAMENLLHTEQGPQKFFEEDRLDVVLSIMKNFKNNSEIHRVCCKILAMLAQVKDIQKKIPHQAVTMVIASLKNFSKCDDLQIVGCGALSSLSENNESLGQAIVEDDGLGVLSSALEKHHSEERLHVVVMMTIANLLPIDKEKHPAAFETAASLIEKSMSMFPEVVAIQIAACEALARFRTSDLPNAPVFIDCLKHILHRHKDKNELMSPAAAALRIFWQDGYRKEADAILESTSELHGVFWSAKPTEHSLDEESVFFTKSMCSTVN